MSPESERSGILEYVRRAFGHAEEAVRAYLMLLAADIEKRYSRILRRSIELLALVLVGVIGLGVFAIGFARFLETLLGPPGSGQMLVGGVVVAGVVVCLLIVRSREGD